MKTPSIRNILVPVDFSLLSALAVQNAQRLSQRFGAAIHLVHVHEFYYPAGFMAPGAPVPIIPITCYDDARRRAAADLRELAQTYEIPDANCYISNDAPVFHAICRVAQKIPADLIVTPTHGRTGLKHVFLGSTAERLVQHAPCPVFVARQMKSRRTNGQMSKNGLRRSIDTILVPVDFSACSLAGLKYAIQFADKAAAKIVALHVVNMGPLLTGDGYAMYDLSGYRELTIKQAESGMKEFLCGVKFRGVKAETLVDEGPPVSVITRVAEERNADLIVTATHGRTGLDHILIGSTAESVVRHASCSVLVVPSHPQERAKRLGKVDRRKTRSRRQPRIAKELPGLDEDTRRERLNPRLHSFPERRKTNKFRESHLSSL